MTDDQTHEKLTASLTGLLQEHLPGFVQLLELQRLTGGASRLMYRLKVETAKGEHIFAFRQNPLEDTTSEIRITMEDEAALLRIAKQAGVLVPGIICTFPCDHPLNEGMGDGYIMEWIEGETLGGRIVKSDRYALARKKMAAQSGVMLARIHNIDVEAHGLAGKLRTVTAKDMVESVYQQYLDLGQAHPMLDYTAQWLAQNMPDTEDYAMTHGDFRNGNLIVTEEGIVAVLDWELAALSDPCRDLAYLCVNSWRFGRADLPVGGFGELEDLFRAYEQERGQPVDRDRFLFWQVYGTFWWSITCLVMGSSYGAGLSKEADRPAIGRRSTEAQIDLANLLIPGPVSLCEAEQGALSGESNIAELAQSIQDTLSEQIVPILQGRNRFLAMVLASNAGTVLRELERGPATVNRQVCALQQVLDMKNEVRVGVLRAALCEKLRNSEISLENEALTDFLRCSIADQVAIDQPTYSGLAVALQRSKNTMS